MITGAVEKAKQLIHRFYLVINESGEPAQSAEDRRVSKICARINCEERIKEFKEMNNNIMGLQFNDRIIYWELVLRAIDEA